MFRQWQGWFVFMASAALLAVWPDRGDASWPTDPTVNLPICTVATEQASPTAIADGSGGTIFLWEDSRNGTLDLFAQRVDAAGRPCWQTGGVAVCVAPGSQKYARTVADGSGGVFVAWRDERYSTSMASTFAQHLDGTGARLWGESGMLVNDMSSNYGEPCMVSDGTGGIIALWADMRTITVPTPPFYAYEYAFYAQRLNSSGVVQWADGGVKAASFSGGDAAAIADGAGGMIFAWSGDPSSTTDPFNIYAQRVSAAGTALWGASGKAVCRATGQQDSPALVPDGAGGVIVAWDDGRSSSTSTDIYAQRIDASGVMRWTSNGKGVCTSSGYQLYPRIVPDSQGGAIIGWSHLVGSNSIAYLQRINSSGVAQWQAGGVSAGLLGTGSFSLAADNAGGTYMSWDLTATSGGDLYAQRWTSSGTRRWTPNLTVSSAPGFQGSSSLAVDELGAATVVWKDDRSGSENDIYAQRVDESGQIGPRCGFQNEIVAFRSGPGTSADDAGQAIGAPDGIAGSLGYGGQLTVQFAAPVVNRAGYDISVYELDRSSSAADNENYRVEASTDGTTFVSLGESGGGVSTFDLAAGGLVEASYVRVTDLPPLEMSSLVDAKSIGADIDAIVSVNCVSNEMSCGDGVDNDGDGLVDCADGDCRKDADGDGMWAPPCGSDCDDHDAAVNPGRAEVCGNGIDDNCDGLTDCADAVCAWSSFARPFACDDPCNARSEFCEGFEWIGGAPPDPDRNFDVVIGGDTERLGTAYLASGLRADALQIVADFARIPAATRYGQRISFWLYRRGAKVPRSNEEYNAPGFAAFKDFLPLLQRYHLEYATFRTTAPPGAPNPFGATLGGKWSFFAPAPETEQSVTALHELGHGLALRDEYRRPECSTARVFSPGDVVPNVLRDQANCDAAVTYYSNCGVSGECVQVCNTGSAWRVDVDNLMQAALDCAPCSPLLGYGPLGDLHIRQLVEGIVTSCFAPERAHTANALGDTSNVASRELRIQLQLESGVAVAATVVIVPDSGRTVVPGGDPAYLLTLDRNGSELSSLPIWNPAMAEVGAAVADPGTAFREYRLRHMDGAATWRFVGVDEATSFQGGTGAAMLEYCRSINWTDPQCWLADADADSIPDAYDNCPNHPNPSQADQNRDGIGDACAPLGVDLTLPTAIKMSAPFPNPTRGVTSVRLDLPSQTMVRAALHDVAGRVVLTIADGRLPPGTHALSWDTHRGAGRAIPAGLYFLRVRLGLVAISKSVIVLP